MIWEFGSLSSTVIRLLIVILEQVELLSEMSTGPAKNINQKSCLHPLQRWKNPKIGRGIFLFIPLDDMHNTSHLHYIFTGGTVLISSTLLPNYRPCFATAAAKLLSAPAVFCSSPCCTHYAAGFILGAVMEHSLNGTRAQTCACPFLVSPVLWAFLHTPQQLLLAGEGHACSLFYSPETRSTCLHAEPGGRKLLRLWSWLQH